MTQQEIEYALVRQVPEMGRGFTVGTTYGDITIPPGWMADRIQEHLERALRCELLAVHGTAANKAVA